MFGLGPTELIVILVLALVLLGPKKLPDVASGLGKAIRQFRKATQDLTSQLDIDDEVKQPFRELKAAIRDEPPPYVPPAIVAPANTVQAAASAKTEADKVAADRVAAEKASADTVVAEKGPAVTGGVDAPKTEPPKA